MSKYIPDTTPDHKQSLTNDKYIRPTSPPATPKDMPTKHGRFYFVLVCLFCKPPVTNKPHWKTENMEITHVNSIKQTKLYRAPIKSRETASERCCSGNVVTLATRRVLATTQQTLFPATFPTLGVAFSTPEGSKHYHHPSVVSL